jgi:hypothetical protein
MRNDSRKIPELPNGAATEQSHSFPIGRIVRRDVADADPCKYLAIVRRQAWLVAFLGFNLVLAGAMVILDQRDNVDYWDLVRNTNATSSPRP